MFKVIAGVECPGAEACADPWVPLSVSWQVMLRGGPAYLYVTGQNGGYIELKVDPDTGALYALIVVDLPPITSRIAEPAPVEGGSQSPVFDLGLWEWKVTPDYKELAKRDVDATSMLAHSTQGNFFVLWFSSSSVGRYLQCGGVRVGISRGGELVNVMVQRPLVAKPELLMG